VLRFIHKYRSWLFLALALAIIFKLLSLAQVSMIPPISIWYIRIPSYILVAAYVSPLLISHFYHGDIRDAALFTTHQYSEKACERDIRNCFDPSNGLLWAVDDAPSQIPCYLIGEWSLEKHRKTLMELVVSENPDIAEIDPLRGRVSQEMAVLARRYGADGSRFQGRRSGSSRKDDPNPMILRDYDHCISCYRCVRVCAEQEGDYAISVENRGFHTRITTEFAGFLEDSACTFCGQCV